MGRPVNKRNFGKGTGNQLKTKFKLGGTEYEGYIVSQRSTRRFRVSSMNDAVTGICTLVDKELGSLDDGDMIVVVKLDDDTVGRATKIYNRVAIVNGNKVPWTFDESDEDGKGQIADADAPGLTPPAPVIPVITIDVQPQNVSVTEGDPAVFTVEASVTEGATLSYLWQEFNDGTETWDPQGETSDTLTIDPTSLALNGKQFRVVVSATGGAEDVTSAVATLTVTPE